MNPRIFLTGFGPFPGADLNPSEKLMGIFAVSAEKWCPEAEIRTAVMETAYTECEHHLMAEINAFSPDVVLSFGVSGRADALFLERFALNMDDADLPDTQGEVRQGRPILPEGPPALTATLNLNGMYQKLTRAGIPVRFSNHAGTYVCNHLFYYGLYHLARLKKNVPMAFIHIPPVTEWTETRFPEVQYAIREADLVQAAQALIRAAAELHEIQEMNEI
jgi:pyroglutamyl-peptidase